MRFLFTANKRLWDKLSFLQRTHRSDRTVTKKEIIIDAVQMLHQINLLLENGFKFAIIDPKGKKHYINKKKEDKNEGGQNTSEN